MVETNGNVSKSLIGQEMIPSFPEKIREQLEQINCLANITETDNSTESREYLHSILKSETKSLYKLVSELFPFRGNGVTASHDQLEVNSRLRLSMSQIRPKNKAEHEGLVDAPVSDIVIGFFSSKGSDTDASWLKHENDIDVIDDGIHEPARFGDEVELVDYSSGFTERPIHKSFVSTSYDKFHVGLHQTGITIGDINIGYSEGHPCDLESLKKAAEMLCSFSAVLELIKNQKQQMVESGIGSSAVHDQIAA